MDNLLGTELKGYELLELIGAGGFGAVYRANQPVVGREVAVKVILPEYASTPMFIRRFETEAQLVARLEHPYIVPLYDYWRDPRGAYLVMRYLKGGSLSRMVRHGGPLSMEQAGIMLNQIASALAVAHSDGVVHRDLKPDNILLDETGNYFLSDFGIAKDLGSEGINLTQTGAIIGSPAYLSPEQITGEDITPLYDVYSLGILLHYTLTGEHPFPGKTPTAMLIHQMQDPMPPLQMHREDIPDALEEVLQRTTAKDPGQRYTSVMELALAFNRALKREVGSTSQVDQLLSTDAGIIITGLTPADAKNPYKGLKAFEEADADEFYGRETLTERLIQRITPQDNDRGDNLLVIVGPSGSGKSSVVKAGIVPRLREGAFPGNDVMSSSDDWFYVELVPGNHPMEEMEAALLRVAVNPPESLLEQLESDERGLVRAIKRVLPDDDSQLVLFIDQFEEVFTLTETEEERRHFLSSLMRAIQEPRNRLRVIITLRADFYDRPLSYFEFGELVREHTEVVLPLSAQELESAIVRPAQRVGVSLEPGLTSAIVADVREQPGALPLLQYALTQLFDRREGGRLTLQAYADIGGAMGALAKRAEEIYEGFDLESRDATQQMFLRLVTLGEGQEDTRRRINQSELNSLGHPEAMDAVIDVYGRQRLLTFDNDPHTREPTLEVAHEALIREWRRLRDWLDTAREDLRTQRRLNQATMEWLHSGQDHSFLATGSRLDQFEGLQTANRVAMNEEESIYLEQSISRREEIRQREEARIAREEALEEKSRRQLQMTLTVVSIAAVIALALAILSGFLFQQSQSNLTLARDSEANEAAARATAEFNANLAQANADEAEARASEAQAVALAANALNVLDNFRPALSLRLALEAVALEPDLQPVQQAAAQAAYAPGALAQINPLLDVSMTGISFSGDGSELAASLVNGQVLVIDATDHTVRLEIPAAEGAEGAILAVDYSPTRPVIASAGVDGVVRLWDAENGKIIHRMEGHTAAINEIAFSPDGRLLLTGADDTRLNLWDVETGDLLQTIGGEAGHPGRIFTVDFSADGRRVISGATDTRDEN
ncbi:MAG: protein kinase, partial [Chloroflexota bacterium]